MRGSLNHRRYRDIVKIIFIEANPLFNRYDIIHRIFKSAGETLIPLTPYVVYFNRSKNSYTMQSIDGVVYGDLKDLMNRVLEGCNWIVLLAEDADYSIENIIRGECFIAGLHTDIPESMESYIESRFNAHRTRLSRIPYLASQIPHILDVYLSGRNHYIHILHI